MEVDEMRFAVVTLIAALYAVPAVAQDAKAWLESQGLEAAEIKPFNDLEAMVARVKGAADPKAAEERVVVTKKGKPVFQTNPKQTDPGTKFTIHSVGRNL